MENPWKQLDSKFVEGLTSDEVDEVFIAYLFLCADDFLTAYDMTLRFSQYPRLDTLEKVDNKTWECIEKMMDRDLIICLSAHEDGNAIDFAELNKHKKDIYEIMEQKETGDNFSYKYLFDITIKGYMFMKTIYWQHRLIINEIINIAYQN